MEELEYKLSSGNPVTIAQLFSKILQSIKEKDKEDIKQSLELKFIRDKCISPDPLISEVAASAFIDLVEDQILQVEPAIADFITTIPIAKYHSSLTKIIANLLNIELKRKVVCNKKFKSSYNLCSPQHPYITILIENPNAWTSIFNEIRFLYTYEDRNHVTELFKPIYLYTLCNPSDISLQLLKQKLFTLVLDHTDLENQFFYDILCWTQVETKISLETNSEFLNEALNYFSTSKQSAVNLEVLLLWQTSILHNLVSNRLDVRSCICSLKKFLPKEDNIVSVDCLLLMLTKTIEICSPIYLLDLLNLCKDLLSYHGKSLYILEALKASLLQWIVCPSILTTRANEVANSMFTYIQTYKPSITRLPLEQLLTQYKKVISANDEVFTSLQVCILLPHFSEENIILRWLDNVEKSPSSLITKLYNFLCGLFLGRSANISLKAFSVILSHVERNKASSSQLLTLILYKLSNTKEPQLHFALLKALPKMAMLRENIPKIMGTLQALSRGSLDLYNFGLSLMFDAWKVEPKCYSYLENMLVQYGVSEKKWETYVMKSFILRELCERKPELYGKDMVAHLSKVLNDCDNSDGSLPCAFAIDGIKSLCRAEIIDVVTTWNTLWPKFKNDTRVPVIKSLCSLIHEIPNLPYTESCTELKNQVIKALWDYMLSDDPQIKEAALNSLTSFSSEEICAQLPEKYLDENIMQDREKSGVGSPQTVPGYVWVKFLSENAASKEACNFLIKLISIEVANYLKYVYQVKGTREPMNYAYLPTHSIVRGIADYVKASANKWKNSVDEVLYVECLKILSKEYSKPLPPLDWCFLQELLHESKVKDYCVDIACHQVILSGTARRLIENYVSAVTEHPQENDIINIMRNLKHVANSIQPIILKPFFEKAIKYAIDIYNNKYEKKLLEKILEHAAEVLRNDNIQETNKMTIAQVLSHHISVTNTKSELFEVFLRCVVALPSKCLEDITNMKDDVSEEWFEKVVKIRCTAAMQTNVTPLRWLNEIVEVSSGMKRNFDTSDEFISVFRKHLNNGSECALWLLDLIGQIQAKMADRCNEKEILYYFDVLILTVVEFSGYSVFAIDQNTDYDVTVKKLFPQAFNALMNMNDWSICTSQALEWLYHVNTEETIPFEYRNIFGSTLLALRHDEEFTKNRRWMKYLGSKVADEII